MVCDVSPANAACQAIHQQDDVIVCSDITRISDCGSVLLIWIGRLGHGDELGALPLELQAHELELELFAFDGFLQVLDLSPDLMMAFTGGGKWASQLALEDLLGLGRDLDELPGLTGSLIVDIVLVSFLCIIHPILGIMAGLVLITVMLIISTGFLDVVLLALIIVVWHLQLALCDLNVDLGDLVLQLQADPLDELVGADDVVVLDAAEVEVFLGEQGQEFRHAFHCAAGHVSG